MSSSGKVRVLPNYYDTFLQQAAVGSVQECGLPGNPLSLSWLSGEPRTVQEEKAPVESALDQRFTSFSDVHQSATRTAPNVSSNSMSSGGGSSLQRDTDYESITLMRLRQAEERKRLAKQLAQQDS